MKTTVVTKDYAIMAHVYAILGEQVLVANALEVHITTKATANPVAKVLVLLVSQAQQNV